MMPHKYLWQNSCKATSDVTGLFGHHEIPADVKQMHLFGYSCLSLLPFPSLFSLGPVSAVTAFVARQPHSHNGGVEGSCSQVGHLWQWRVAVWLILPHRTDWNTMTTQCGKTKHGLNGITIHPPCPVQKEKESGSTSRSGSNSRRWSDAKDPRRSTGLGRARTGLQLRWENKTWSKWHPPCATQQEKESGSTSRSGSRSRKRPRSMSRKKWTWLHRSHELWVLLLCCYWLLMGFHVVVSGLLKFYFVIFVDSFGCSWCYWQWMGFHVAVSGLLGLGNSCLELIGF